MSKSLIFFAARYAAYFPSGEITESLTCSEMGSLENCRSRSVVESLIAARLCPESGGVAPLYLYTDRLTADDDQGNCGESRILMPLHTGYEVLGVKVGRRRMSWVFSSSVLETVIYGVGWKAYSILFFSPFRSCSRSCAD